MVTVAACLLFGGCGRVTPTAAPQTRTLGFVVRDWFTSVYDSKFADECPEGLTPSNDEIWWRNLPKPERARLTNNGLVQNLNRMPE
jgi:hypothetical protein